jgi:hypothetical protein
VFTRILDRIGQSIVRMLTASTGSIGFDFAFGIGASVYALFMIGLVLTEAGRLTGIWIPSWPTPYNRGWMPQWIELVSIFSLGLLAAFRAYNYLKPVVAVIRRRS